VIEGAGHYGIFSGRRWREFIRRYATYPQVRDFIRPKQIDVPECSRRPSASRTAARMIVSQPGDVMIQRVHARRRQHARLTPAAAGNLAPASRLVDQRSRTHQQRNQPGAPSLWTGTPKRYRNAARSRAPAHHSQPPRCKAARHPDAAPGPLAREVVRGAQVIGGKHASVPGVFQRQHTRACEMRIDRLDRSSDFVQRQRAVASCTIGCG
jgi:hypothetical protein